MTNTLISVIVPVYNLESYIAICLDSLLSQRYSNLEIIVIDDGSTDRSLEICALYASKDSRIKLFSQPNAGVSSARNLGLKNVTGKYFLFVDGDDYIGSDHIYNLYSHIKLENCDICIGSYSEVCPNNLILKNNISHCRTLSSEEAILNMVYRHDFGGEPVSKLFSTELILNNQNIYFDISEKVGEDFSFCYAMFNCAKRIYVCNESSYMYVRRDNSATMSSVKKSLNRLRSAKKYQKFIMETFPNSLLEKSVLYYYNFCFIEILNRTIDTHQESKYLKLRKIIVSRIRKEMIRLMLDSNSEMKFKIKLLLISTNWSLYKIFRERYLKSKN